MSTTQPQSSERFLGMVERLGNKLPDPVIIFLAIIAVLVVVSVIGAAAGWTAIHPVSGEVIKAKSLLSEENVRSLLSLMPKTYTAFAPLGSLLVVVLGAGIADRSGLMTALVRGAIIKVPASLLIPATLLTGMVTTHAVDAGYLVFVPLAGAAFAATGRNPLLGIILGFIGCAVGLVGNLLPGAYDVLVLSITHAAALMFDKGHLFNPVGNWWFSLAIAALWTTIGWAIAVRVLEPRLGAWSGGAVESLPEPDPREGRALRAAGLAALGMFALFAMLLW